MKTIGMIAGNGIFPLLAAREAAGQGYRVVACAIQKEADPQIENVAAACCWVKLGELKKLVKFFKAENVHEAIMAGKVEKVRLFRGNVQPDLDMMKVLMKTKNFKDDSLLGAIADYLEGEQVKLLDSTFFLKRSLPGAGVLSRKKPSKEILEDIRFGFQTAKAIAGLDFGQTVVVKKKAVLAAEAIEGTDEAILRGGHLGGDKATVVKVAKPNQDMRFDVPAVGLRTLARLIEIKAQAFAFEADKTLILEKEDFLNRADQHGIVVMGINETL